MNGENIVNAYKTNPKPSISAKIGRLLFFQLARHRMNQRQQARFTALRMVMHRGGFMRRRSVESPWTSLIACKPSWLGMKV